MRDLVKSFLSENDKHKIIECVKSVEKKTSGEIVPMIVTNSYEYPMSNLIGSLSIATPLAVAATFFTGPLFGLSDHNMWILLGFLALFGFTFFFMIKNIHPLKRFFISPAEIEEEVQEAAFTAFYREGLYKTRDKTGILIFISIFERKVWVLADKGINDKVDKTVWNEIVNIIIEGIKKGKQADAVCSAIERAGELIIKHFPVKPDDTDELDNLIIR